MLKYSLSIIFILFSKSLCQALFPSREPYECEDIGLTCQKDEICCKAKNSFDGYLCFKGVKSICCADLGFACPAGTKCDFDNKFCTLNSLTFLSSESKINKALESDRTPLKIPVMIYSEVLDDNSNDKEIEIVQKIIRGFLEGFPLFKNATENNNCVDNKEFTGEAMKLYKILSGINFDDPNIKNKLYALIDTVLNQKELIRTEINECKRLINNIDPSLKTLNDIISKKGYFDKFTLNLIGSLKKISKIANEIQEKKHEKEYLEVGKLIGELVKLVFFWEI